MLTAHCQFLLFCSVLLAFILCPTPGCRAYRDPGVRRAETRVSDVPRPGCQTCQDPGVMQCPSVSPCFLSAFRCSFPRACAYIIMYPFCQTFHPTLKNMFFNMFINQRVNEKVFIFRSKKSSDIFGVYVIKSYFCTRFREREQRCFDILTGTV